MSAGRSGTDAQTERGGGVTSLARDLVRQARSSSPAIESFIATRRARLIEANRLYIPDAADREKYYRPSILALSK